MKAISYDIIEKRRGAPVDLAAINDFLLGKSSEVSAEEILENPYISLYTLDFESGQGVFVETSPDANLEMAPFYYSVQYDKAVRVLTASFETMIELAKTVDFDAKKLIVIHSVGRAGSTLASQIFAQLPGVVNISEPDALTFLTIGRAFQPDNEAGLLALLDATVRLLCKNKADTAWVIKGRSFVAELGAWLHKLYPQAKTLFLYRDAETWLRSILRAFLDGTERGTAAFATFETGVRAMAMTVTPLVAQVAPDTHLSIADICSLMWLSVMECSLDMLETGMEILPIQYKYWRSHPRETAVSMLAHCNCLPDDLTAVYATLTKDSQADSMLSQDAVQKKDAVILPSDFDDLKRQLQAHPTIQRGDFELPNTLTLA